MFDLFDTLQQKISSILNYIGFGIIAIIGLLLVSSMVRFLFGKKHQLGKAITSAMEILCLYMICIVIYSFGIHWDIFLNPLPFISLQNGTLEILPILSTDFSDICPQIAKLLMIAFLVNLMNAMIPEGKKLHVWLLLRATTVVWVVGVNYVLDVALFMWLPDGIGQIAPLILLVVPILLILLGSLKMVVGATLFVANPVFGALYTFFFSNLIGRSLARSVISAGLLFALFYLLNSFGILTLTLSAASLIALFPVLLIIILLWYVVDRIV